MNSPEKMCDPNLRKLPGLTGENDEQVFAEPWQAQAFAMVVELVDAGHFSWQEWADALGQQLKTAEERGNPDDGSRYYHNWVTALETLLTNKSIAAEELLHRRKNDWANAYRNTPHGQPVSLIMGQLG